VSGVYYRRAYESSTPSGRQDVVVEALLEMNVPPYLWVRIQDGMKIAESLGVTPTRATVMAAIESLGPEVKPPPPPRPPPPKAAPVVYYLRFGDRVKIGTTVNLPRRLTAIPHDELLATEPGSFAVEKERHLQFKGDHVKGEWFHMSSAIMEHVKGLTCP
jgi:hypothetical protein